MVYCTLNQAREKLAVFMKHFYSAGSDLIPYHFQSIQDNRHSLKIISTNYINTVVPPGDGPRYARNM